MFKKKKKSQRIYICEQPPNKNRDETDLVTWFVRKDLGRVGRLTAHVCPVDKCVVWPLPSWGPRCHYWISCHWAKTASLSILKPMTPFDILDNLVIPPRLLFPPKPPGLSQVKMEIQWPFQHKTSHLFTSWSRLHILDPVLRADFNQRERSLRGSDFYCAEYIAGSQKC